MKDPQVGWIAAIIIGGVAGWLAEQFMKRSKVWDEPIAEIVIPPDFYFASAKNRLRG
jgi:hypothetical protein